MRLEHASPTPFKQRKLELLCLGSCQNEMLNVRLDKLSKDRKVCNLMTGRSVFGESVAECSLRLQ